MVYLFEPEGREEVNHEVTFENIVSGYVRAFIELFSVQGIDVARHEADNNVQNIEETYDQVYNVKRWFTLFNHHIVE